jgi:rubrerythrin
MVEKELKIRDVYHYALDIPNYNGSNFTLFFNLKENAENVKRIIEIDRNKSDEAACDIQKIKHGKWKYNSGDVDYANYLCSECGNFLTFYEDIDLYPYCPYCGAKMDKIELGAKGIKFND